jgi:glyoxylase-like metal-dependent hydrolase (beta-lactamase superfamily II)
MIEILPVGQLAANCYLFYDPLKKDALIIDPGDDAGFVMNRITDLALKPRAIVATHGHFDHILAVTELKLGYQIPFFIHRGDVPIVKRMKRTAEYFTGGEADAAPQYDKLMKDQEIIKVGKSTLSVLSTPGHTPGGICLYSKKEKIVFTGDTIFAGGSYGRTDLAGGDADKLKDSILKILSLPEDTVIYPGHGEETSVKKEKRFYRFLVRSNAVIL